MVYEDVSPTLTTTHYGEPAVCFDEEIVAIEGNGTRPSHLGGGFAIGKKMYTLNSTEVHAIAYRISSYESNCMKSKNPYSGINETDISPTLDNVNCGYPACNQGGVIIIEERKGN